MNSVLRPGDTVLTFGPTFTLYKNIAEGIGADYKELSFQEKQNIPSVDEISKFNPKLIILCSPNNPTGHITQKEQIKKLLNNNKDTLVLVDEAYIDF
jgi:histidinol-phosphate aminotransferase